MIKRQHEQKLEEHRQREIELLAQIEKFQSISNSMPSLGLQNSKLDTSHCSHYSGVAADSHSSKIISGNGSHSRGSYQDRELVRATHLVGQATPNGTPGNFGALPNRFDLREVIQTCKESNSFMPPSNCFRTLVQHED